MTTHPDLSVEPFSTHAPGPLLAAILRQTENAGRGWLAKRWMYLLRAIGIKLLAGRPVDVERLGARMRLDPAHNTAEKRLLFTPQLFDPGERDVLRQAMGPKFAFADVGANVGGYALAVAAMAGSDAQILAVEPQPDIHARLRANVALSGFEQIHLSNCAVSDREERVFLHINPVNKGESSLLEGGGAGAGTAIEVQARRLVTLLEEAGFDRLDAMKIDVEGMEDRILTDFFQPGVEKLWPRLLIVEDAPTRWTSDVRGLIESRGYREIAHTATNMIFERG